MHKLDRVFDGQDVGGHAVVDVVDHRRQRGGLTRTGRAGNQYQTARVFGDFLENARRFQFFQRQHFARNGTEYRSRTAFGIKGVHTETRHIGQFERKVGFQILLVVFALQIVHYRSDHIADFFRVHFRQIDAADVAIHTDHRRQAGRDVQVGGFVFDSERQEVGNLHRHGKTTFTELEYKAGIVKKIMLFDKGKRPSLPNRRPLFRQPEKPAPPICK